MPSASPLRLALEPYPPNNAFRADWAAMHAACPWANVFTRLEWLEQGWASFAAPTDRPRPIRFVDANERTMAMGFFRLTSSRRRPWGRLSTWRTVDFNAQRIVPLLAPDLPAMADALAALHRGVGYQVDGFDFFKLDPLGGGLEALARLLRKRGVVARLEPFNEQPRLRLDGPPDEPLRGKHARRNLGQLWRKIGREQGPLSFRRLRCPEDYFDADIHELLKPVFDVYSRSWQHAQDAAGAPIAPERLAAFYERIACGFAPLGMLDLNLLSAGGRLIAFDLNLVEKGAVYMLLGAYDQELRRYSPGSLLLAEWLEDSRRRGDRVAEFGADFLEYKKQWANDTETGYRLRLPGGTLYGRLRSWLWRWNASAPRSGRNRPHSE